MSKYFGDILEDGTIEIPFNTYNADGASVTFTGTTVKVYKDSATGTEVTAGVTLSKDHDGITGGHLVTIVTTDVFYATGSDYLVELQAATIATQTVNSFLGTFSIQNRYMRGTDGVDTATMRGTDGVDTATMRGTDGVDTATMRGTDGANTTVPDAAGVVPTAVENRQEMDSNSTQLASILSTGSTGPWTTGAGGDATEANQTTILAKLLSYVRILARKDAAIATDDAAQVTEINADEGAGAGAYNNTTDSQEAIKDAISGGGGTPGIS